MPLRAEACVKPAQLSRVAPAVPWPPSTPAQCWQCQAEPSPLPAPPWDQARTISHHHTPPGTSRANAVTDQPCTQVGQQVWGDTCGCPFSSHHAAPGRAMSPKTSAWTLVGASGRGDPQPLWAELWRSNNNPPSVWLVITDGICMETGCFYSLQLHLLLLKSPLCT